MRRALFFAVVFALSAPALADPVVVRASAAEHPAAPQQEEMSAGELKARCESGGGCVIVLERELDALLSANRAAAKAVRLWYDRTMELQRKLDEKSKAGCS